MPSPQPVYVYTTSNTSGVAETKDDVPDDATLETCSFCDGAYWVPYPDDEFCCASLTCGKGRTEID